MGAVQGGGDADRSNVRAYDFQPDVLSEPVARLRNWFCERLNWRFSVVDRG